MTRRRCVGCQGGRVPVARSVATNSRTRVRLSRWGPLPFPPTAVWSGAGSCGRATAVAVGSRSVLRASAVGVRWVCGRPVRATLISSSNTPSSATGGRRRTAGR